MFLLEVDHRPEQRGLEGRGKAPLETLRERMTRAAREQGFEYAALLRNRLEGLRDFQEQLAAFRGEVRSLSFVYRVPGFRGADPVYLIRRGRVRAEEAHPKTGRARARVEDVSSEPDGGPGGLTSHEAAEILFVARWFRLRPEEVFRGSDVDLRVPTDVFERYHDHYAAAEETPTSGPTPVVRGILVRMEQVGAVPDGLPAYTRLLVDPAGRLWAERFRFPWEGTPFWAVFDTGGAFLGHVEMPPGFTLHEVGPHWITGSEPDGSGGWRVRVYPLGSQAGPASEGEEG